jgi:hypothetical protein
MFTPSPTSISNLILICLSFFLDEGAAAKMQNCIDEPFLAGQNFKVMLTREQ